MQVKPELKNKKIGFNFKMDTASKGVQWDIIAHSVGTQCASVYCIAIHFKLAGYRQYIFLYIYDQSTMLI